jgi:acetolactate synthase-1/2/3 large subunit
MKVADIVWKVIKEYTDTVFYLPGGGCMWLVDSLGKSGLNYVSCLHEQGAGFAALGYAQMKRGLGVALVTSGPGSTNIITPVAAAWMDSIPFLVISGQAPTYALVGDTGLRSRGSQEIDIVSIIKPITKDAFILKIKYMTERFLNEMITKCLSERQGPCWLDIPLDVQVGEICDQ